MKQKLLLALLALFTGVGTLSAQTWTGSEVQAGEFYLYNIAAKQFVNNGSAYGTRAIRDYMGIPITVSDNGDGTWNLMTKVNDKSLGYDGALFYTDMSGDMTKATFEPVSGKTNVYNIKFTNGSDTRYIAYNPNYKYWDRGMTASGEAYQWMLVSRTERDEASSITSSIAKKDSPIDVTYKYFQNPNFTGKFPAGFENDTWEGDAWAINGNTAWNANPFDQNAEHYNKNFDTYKTLNNLPAGKYRFYVTGFYRDCGNGGAESVVREVNGGNESIHNALIYANEQTKELQTIGVGRSTELEGFATTVNDVEYRVPNSQGQAVAFFWNDQYPEQYVDAFVSSEGTLRIGVKKSVTIGADWTLIDKFHLAYLGPTIEAVATELPTDGTMVANKWYYFDIATDGEYTLNASDLTTIIKTTEGNILIEDEDNVTDVFASSNIELSTGKYYVKASNDNNLTIEVKSYSYIIGTPTTSIADGDIYKSITTYTASFNDAATNDPDATFAILNNEAKAQLTKNGSVIAEGALSLDGKTLTATFPETVLEIGGTYVLSIPAGVVGYDGQASNDAISTNIETPAIADGYYFLRDAQGRYVGRGSSYNTRAIMEAFGLPMHVETSNDGNGITTFTFVDSNLKLFDAGSGTVYTDNTSNPNWKIEATNGGFHIINKNNNGSYDKKLGTDGGTWMQSNDNGLVWTFEPAVEHNTYMEALKDQQAVTAATAAGIESITNRSSLEAKLASDYIPQTISIDDVAWDQKYQVSAGTEWDGNGVKYYENTANNLKPGLYKLTVKAFYRMTWNDILEAAAGARGNVYLYGNNVKTQLYSVFDFPADEPWVDWNDYKDTNGKYYPNNPDGGQAAFNAGNYVNELYVYINADEGAETGTLNYGIHQPSRFSNGQWCGYQNFTLTYYSDNNDVANADDYAALNTAIQAAEANTLGFDSDEYAPYNNVAALQALATAKAIDQEAINSKEYVTNTTTTLTAAIWTVNTEEVNAVYDGTFANAENNGAPAGWRMSNNTLGGEYHSRAFVGDDRLAEFNETNSGFFMRFDGTNSNRGSMYFYGDTEGYTMPLKANTTYYVKVDFAGWGSTGKPLRMNVTGPEGFTSVNQQYNTSVRADNADNTPQQFYILFTTANAGNYVINFQTPGADSNTHNVVISNCELFKAETVTVTVNKNASDADGYCYGTLYYSDKALVVPDGLTAYTYKVTDGTLSESIIYETGNVIPAATGVVVKTTSNSLTENASFAFTVTAESGEVDSNNMLHGTDEAATTNAGEGNWKYYALSLNSSNTAGTVGFYFRKGCPNGEAFQNGAHKAYLAVPVDQTSGARGFAFNDVVTGIERIMNTDKTMENGEIYNLAGQRVNNAQKGVYIVNGKKVVVK